MVTPYQKRRKLVWTADSMQAYEKMVQKVIANNKLYFLEDGLPLTLETDACDYGVGAYLYQTKPDGTHRPIQFISKVFSSTQLRWGVNEKEAYAIFYSFMELGYLLRYTDFKLRTDHKNLTYITHNDHASPTVMRWRLAIQDFNFTVEHVAGVENVVADALSRLVGVSVPEPEDNRTHHQPSPCQQGYPVHRTVERSQGTI